MCASCLAFSWAAGTRATAVDPTYGDPSRLTTRGNPRSGTWTASPAWPRVDVSRLAGASRSGNALRVEEQCSVAAQPDPFGAEAAGAPHRGRVRVGPTLRCYLSAHCMSCGTGRLSSLRLPKLPFHHSPVERRATGNSSGPYFLLDLRRLFSRDLQAPAPRRTAAHTPARRLRRAMSPLGAVDYA